MEDGWMNRTPTICKKIVSLDTEEVLYVEREERRVKQIRRIVQKLNSFELKLRMRVSVSM